MKQFLQEIDKHIYGRKYTQTMKANMKYDLTNKYLSYRREQM